MILLLSGLASASCPEADQDAFTIRPRDLPPVPIVLELRGSPEGLDPLLRGLEDRGLAAALIFEDARSAGAYIGLAERGHELVLSLDTSGWDATNASWLSSLRGASKSWKRATGAPLDSLVVTDIPRAGEAAANQLRLETLLVDQPGRAHLAPALDGSHGRTLLLPTSGLCAEPLTELHHAQMDELSARLQAVPNRLELALRLPLSAEDLDEAEQDLLLAWLDQVALPAGAVVRIPRDLEPRLPTHRSPTSDRPEGIRPLDLAELETAARALLDDPEQLAAELPGPLTPTEAYLGLVQALADQLEVPPGQLPPDQVLLHGLGPPAEEASSSRSGPVTAGQVRETAQRLAPFLRSSIPSFVEVGAQTLTASELLLAMAWVLLEAPSDDVDVPLATPRPPDPYAEGLGWGRSGL